MDYIMRIIMVIDTEAKKNTIRNSLKADIEQQYSLGNIKSWNMDIEGQVVPTEDHESYREGE